MILLKESLAVLACWSLINSKTNIHLQQAAISRLMEGVFPPEMNGNMFINNQDKQNSLVYKKKRTKIGFLFVRNLPVSGLQRLTSKSSSRTLRVLLLLYISEHQTRSHHPDKHHIRLDLKGAKKKKTKKNTSRFPEPQNQNPLFLAWEFMGLSRAVQISRHIPSVDERDPARTWCRNSKQKPNS